MDKFKLAELGERLKTGGAQMGERLKTGGAQMGRIVSEKMKEILQTPTPESKMVDEATSETLEEPNWGMNLRICAMINSEEFSGSEIVRAIKKKISGKSVAGQRLSLDLLEACAMNCEKVFSEVSSEKVLDEMIKIIDNPQSDHGNRVRAMQLIKAWGESEDLAYLPVFHQTYLSLKGRLGGVEPENSPFVQYLPDSYVPQQSVAPPERYPIPNSELQDSDQATFSLNSQNLSVEEKRDFLAIARNSFELFSSILNTETEPKHLKEDLTLSMYEKCKELQPIIKGIVENTADDEGILFEALHLHDELQLIISKYDDLEAGHNSEDHPENANKELSEVSEKSGGKALHRSDSTEDEDLGSCLKSQESSGERSSAGKSKVAMPGFEGSD